MKGYSKIKLFTNPIKKESNGRLGKFELNQVHQGDCLELAKQLPDNCIDLIITSPPYWGQRTSNGIGIEEDPRDYLDSLTKRFTELKRVMKTEGLLWVNLGDAYNTPINWRQDDRKYSTLGPDKNGLNENNPAYVKPRLKRKVFIDENTSWLQYGNLLAIPYRLVVALCDAGFLFRGEVIWKKKNPMPEGRCRRPHRTHEGIYLFAKTEKHEFKISPSIKSVWEFSNESLKKVKHFSRFPTELPLRCIQAYGKTGKDVVVLDPFSGSGTTGIAAINLGCSYLGFEIDNELVRESNKYLKEHKNKKSSSDAVVAYIQQ